jgi:integrase
VAEAKKATILNRFRTGQITQLSTDTVGGYLAAWVDRREAHGEIRRSSAQTYRSVFPIFTDAHGDKQLVAVNAATLREWVTQTVTAHGAKATRYTGSIVKKAFKQAVKEGVLAFNPWEQVDLPAKQETLKDHTLDEEDIKTVWETSYRYKHGLGARLCLESGLRRGELAALRWSDISDTGTISVTRTATPIRGGGIDLKEPKTKRSRRKVRVSETMRDEINKLREGKNPKHFILGDHEPSHPCSVSAGMNSVLKAAGMVGLTAHDLRHAHATHLLRAKLSPAAVSRRLGHSRTSITLDVYAHALDADEDDIIGVVNNVLR